MLQILLNVPFNVSLAISTFYFFVFILSNASGCAVGV